MIIKIRSKDGEYRVPGTQGEADAYYTSCSVDAYATCLRMYGPSGLGPSGLGAIELNGKLASLEGVAKYCRCLACKASRMAKHEMGRIASTKEWKNRKPRVQPFIDQKAIANGRTHRPTPFKPTPTVYQPIRASHVQGDMFGGRVDVVHTRAPQRDHTGHAIDASLDRPDMGKFKRAGWAYNSKTSARTNRKGK